MALVVHVVPEWGADSTYQGVDEFVFRRREAKHPGSEVALRPGHARLLALSEACEARIKSGASTVTLALPAGIVDVENDRVTVLVPAPVDSDLRCPIPHRETTR